MAGIAPMISSQRMVSFAAAHEVPAPMWPAGARAVNPLGRAFELLVQIGFAFKHQLDDNLDGARANAVDQPVNQSPQSRPRKKRSPVRPDKAPEL